MKRLVVELSGNGVNALGAIFVGVSYLSIRTPGAGVWGTGERN
ncbi:MAG: hypothetical protein WCA35_02350 [Kovacikia sp.]